MFCKRVSVFSPQAAGSAQLRVPTTRQAYTWWDPKYWSVARPTDFCYGDCVWGLDNQPVPLSIIEWLCALFRREELECTLEDEPEEYHDHHDDGQFHIPRVVGYRSISPELRMLRTSPVQVTKSSGSEKITPPAGRSSIAVARH